MRSVEKWMLRKRKLVSKKSSFPNNRRKLNEKPSVKPRKLRKIGSEQRRHRKMYISYNAIAHLPY